MKYDPNFIPSKMVIEGQTWVQIEAYEAAVEALREKQRTTASHNHQFAEIHDLWQNLPHTHAGAPYAASSDAFRKHGLCVTGYCDVDTVDVASHDAALAIAPIVAKHARKAHGYALTIVRGSLVVCTTPHSQSFKTMGKERFHASKAAVLDWGHALLGVEA